MPVITSFARSAALQLWLPLVLFALIWVGSANAESVYFPTVPEVGNALWADLVNGGLLGDIAYSLTNLAIGFALGVGAGIVAGVLIGENDTLRVATAPMLDFIRAVPKLGLVPIVILTFGIGAEPKIFLIALAAFFPVLLNTISGVHGIDPAVRETARAYRIPPLLRYRRVVVPGAAPRIFAGARIALQVSVVVMIVSEIFGSPTGLGHYILTSGANFRVRETWAGTILIGVIGYLLTMLLLVVQHYALAWYEQRDRGGRRTRRNDAEQAAPAQPAA